MAKKRVFRLRKVSRFGLIFLAILPWISKIVEGIVAGSGAVAAASAATASTAAGSVGVVGAAGAAVGALATIKGVVASIPWLGPQLIALYSNPVTAVITTIVLLIALIIGCEECEECGSCGGCMGVEDSEGDGSDAYEDIPSNQNSLKGQSEKGVCVPSVELPNGVDDDCDGPVDEEDCGDGIDNDGDGICSETGGDCTGHEDCPEYEDCIMADEGCA